MLKLSFNENSLSELHTADKHSFLQSTLLDESNPRETSEVSRVTEEERSEVYVFADDETMEGSTCGEEGIEPSTDEELRVWRYPQGKGSVDESAREGQEEGISLRNQSKAADVKDAPELEFSDKTGGFVEEQEDKKSGGKVEAQGSYEIQTSDSHGEEKNSAEGRKNVIDGPKADGSKKVTFILEPELINSSLLSEGGVSSESRSDTVLSGERSLKAAP